MDFQSEQELRIFEIIDGYGRTGVLWTDVIPILTDTIGTKWENAHQKMSDQGLFDNLPNGNIRLSGAGILKFAKIKRDKINKTFWNGFQVAIFIVALAGVIFPLLGITIKGCSCKSESKPQLQQSQQPTLKLPTLQKKDDTTKANPSFSDTANKRHNPLPKK